MKERIYVALDLETTGLDATRDKIIEIGAVKFQGEQILDTFSTFVCPNRPIPLRISQITGIFDQDVAEAPALEDVIPELLAFVDSDVAALVAHNASFDIGFLRAAGVNFHRPAQDTFELATIILPGCSSYSLGQICKEEGIKLESAHRALDDTMATAHLFMRIEAKLRALPPVVIADIIASAQSIVDNQSWPPLILFTDAQNRLVNTQDSNSILTTASTESSHESSTETPVDDDKVDGEKVDDGKVDGEKVDDDKVDPITEQVYRPIDPENVAKSFAPDGALAQQMGASYEARSGQQQMARQVAEAFNKGESHIIEAGTGTGKSLAYLLPAALWSLQNERRVVVATNTIPLQEQLLNKDIPQLLDILSNAYPEAQSSTFRAALLKGRGNYLCMRRLNSWRRNRALSIREMIVLARVLVWQQVTKTGDVSELFLPIAEEREIWSHLCSDTSTCSEQHCATVLDSTVIDSPINESNGQSPNKLDPNAASEITGQVCDPKSDERDYYLAARKGAESSNILVINHALLFADVAAENNLIPPYDHLIVDETHHLEDAASDQLTYHVSWHTVRHYLKQLQGDGAAVQSLQRMLNSDDKIDEYQRNLIDERLTKLSQKAKQVDNQIEDFAAQLLSFSVAQKGIKKGAGFPQRLYLGEKVRNKSAWSQLETEWDLSSYDLNELLKQTNELVDLLHESGWHQAGQKQRAQQQSVQQNKRGQAKAVNELSGIVSKLGDMHKALDKTLLLAQSMSSDRDNNIYWLQLSRYTTSADINVTPLRVSDTLEQELVRKKRCAIFTGATLRAGSSFDFLGERLGLWDVKAVTVESPFDYEKSTLLYLPESMPTPDQSNYQVAVEQAIVAAATATNGRTMALFTSHAHLRATADAIRAPLDQLGITTLQHGSSGRRRLLSEFRETEKAVLLGTRTFWEGVDFPGDQLQSLLIVKLPFAVPNDPIVAARSAEFDDPFSAYMLPDAILRFRQGFGRLIRRIDDRGAIVLLDSRLWHKSYGQSFLDALPTCTICRAPLENIQGEIEAWMSKVE